MSRLLHGIQALHAIATLLLFLILANTSVALFYPITTSLDEVLPELGRVNNYLPPGLQERGFFDYQAQILCTGPMIGDSVPRKFLPEDWQPGPQNQFFPPNFYRIYGKNLIKLCARTRYGGSSTAWNAGGYCIASVSPRTVAFDQLPPDGDGMGDLVKEIFLLCQHSCRCLEGSRDEIRRAGRPAAIITRENAPTLDEITDNPDEYEIHKPHPERAVLYTTYPFPDVSRGTHIPVYFIPEVDARSLNTVGRIRERRAATTLWLPAFPGSFAPECTGDFNTDVFDSRGVTPQQACAAQWFGGSTKGNAGLVCKDLGVGQRFIVATSEKSVQHPVLRDLTINGWPMNRYRELARDCAYHCVCPEEKKKPVQEESLLVEGMFEAAKDFVDQVCRAGQFRPGLSTGRSCPAITGSGRRTPTNTRRVGLNRALRRTQMCKTQKVNGFDLAASIAVQMLCIKGMGKPGSLSSLGLG